MTIKNAAALSFRRVSHSFGNTEVLRDLTFEVLTGEFVAIVGPSGCGKTTLLNLASGYDQPLSGSIDSEGQVRMVFQKDGLFPWLTVQENIALGLRSQGNPEFQREQTRDLLHLIQLESFAGHYPHQLSGGMRQRVELARALAGQSDILLLDEPFSALDYLTRLRMRSELARILHERPKTILLVTHDIEEAAQLADRIFVLSSRPATIQFEHSICAPRPREITHPDVIAATDRILQELGLRASTLQNLELE